MDDEILRELKKISKILLLSNAPLIEKELERIASTIDRKKMWLLIDGIRTPKDIADQTGVSTRAVQYFLSAAQVAEFIGRSKTSVPYKLLDYVPPSWLELSEIQGEQDKVITKDLQDSRIKTEDK
jgi:hypothetical protein